MNNKENTFENSLTEIDESTTNKQKIEILFKEYGNREVKNSLFPIKYKKLIAEIKNPRQKMQDVKERVYFEIEIFLSEYKALRTDWNKSKKELHLPEKNQLKEVANKLSDNKLIEKEEAVFEYFAKNEVSLSLVKTLKNSDSIEEEISREAVINRKSYDDKLNDNFILNKREFFDILVNEGLEKTEILDNEEYEVKISLDEKNYLDAYSNGNFVLTYKTARINDNNIKTFPAWGHYVFIEKTESVMFKNKKDVN